MVLTLFVAGLTSIPLSKLRRVCVDVAQNLAKSEILAHDPDLKLVTNNNRSDDLDCDWIAYQRGF